MIVLASWKFRVIRRVEAYQRQKHFNSTDEQISIVFVANMMGGSRLLQVDPGRIDSATRGLWNDFQECARILPENKFCNALTLRTADFCLRAGMPAPRRDALDNIYALRTHLSRGSGVEEELRKEIEGLRGTARQQQRIITYLSFRHMLEMLPPPSSAATSSTAKWKTFYVSALQKAQTMQKQQNLSHPFTALLQKYPKVKQIEETGTNLYGTLSTNIHHYAGEFKVESDQWDSLQVDLMTALIPLAHNKTDAGVDWSQERQRF